VSCGKDVNDNDLAHPEQGWKRRTEEMDSRNLWRSLCLKCLRMKERSFYQDGSFKLFSRCIIVLGYYF
jgi:hypothetical protein